MTPSVDLEQLQQLTREAVHEADKNGLIRCVLVPVPATATTLKPTVPAT